MTTETSVDSPGFDTLLVSLDNRGAVFKDGSIEQVKGYD